MPQQDFELSGNGDVVIEDNNISLIEDQDVFVQAFRQILSTRLGEYFLNLEEGLDFAAFLGAKELDIELATQALYNASIQVDDFVKFESITFDYNRTTRTLRVNLKALFQDGFLLSVSEEVNIGV